MNKILHFKTNILLKNLIGKDLVNNDNIAIVELVKNSYDAGSQGVFIEFTNFLAEGKSNQTSQIIIADEGSGMDLIDIEDKWLNIAYSEKKLMPQQNGAYLAGNKGIGRFSCDRLGKRLDLLTRKRGGDLLHLEILWADFEKEGDKERTIQKVPLIVHTIEDIQAANLANIQTFPEQGTVLVISELRSTWNYERIKNLKIDLEKFLNPNQLFARERFRIHLHVDAFAELDRNKDYAERVNGEVQNQIFEKLKFNTTYIDAKISDDNATLTTVLYHEDDKVFELFERNDTYQLLAGTHIVIYYLNPYKKAYFKRQTGVRSVDFGSMFLFLNGFRIAPYGDRGDDWLGLDVRKTQGTSRYLGSRDIVGRIEIGGNEEAFKPISSREGLKNTTAFNQLRENLFVDILRKLEKFVVEGLHWDSVPSSLRRELRDSKGLDWDNTQEQYSESWDRKQQRIALSMMTLIGSSPDRIINFWFNPALLEGIYESRQEEVQNLLADIGGFEPDQVDASLTKGISKFKELITNKEKEVQVARSAAADLRIEVAQQDQKIDVLQDERETYRAQTLFLQQVTSLDVKQLMAYHHQINLDSTIVNNYMAKAIKILRDVANTTAVLDNLQKASLANKRIAAIAQYATKANFRSGTKKELTDIPAFFEQYLRHVATDFITTNLKLVVYNHVEELFEIKASRIELSILIDNIISNASKAQAKKLVMTTSKILENTLQISFVDDGKGLSPELQHPDSIFEMGVTTTSGSGLGLYHAKSIIDKIDGKISAIPNPSGGMEIRIEIIR